MIRLRSLGECVIDLGGVRVGPESEVLFALLLYLIVERGHRVPRARLIELCWPGECDERARHNLRQALYKAKQLGATIGQDAGDVVMPAAEVWADYDELLDPSTQRGAPTLEFETVEFLPSYQAGLSDVFAEWLESRRAIVHSALRRHLVSRIAAARRSARWSEVERLARRCLELDEMNEEAVIGLAEATAVTGSRAKAAAILDKYLDDLGPDAKLLGRPARELRRRIQELPQEERGPQTSFIGREEELALLLARLDRAIAGEGGAVLIQGDPGIGKSALVYQLMAVARVRGVTVGATYVHYAAQPQALSMYAAVVDTLLQLPGSLGCSPDALDYCYLLTGRETRTLHERPSTADLLQHRIHEATVEQAIAIADESPFLLTIEDTHCSDDASLACIASLANALKQSRSLLVLTSRRPLLRVWPEPLLNDLLIVQVRGLAGPSSRELLSLWSGGAAALGAMYVEWCLRIADGHPLYLRELGDQCRSGGETFSMPPSLVSLLTSRMDKLSFLAKRALQFCALLARDSTLERLERLLAVPLAEFSLLIEELERADVVSVDGDTFVIRHDLLGEAALAQLPPGTRRTLHKRLALLLELEPHSAHSAAMSWKCAEHWLAAGEQRRAGRAVRVTALHLIRIGLPAESVALLRAYLSNAIDSAERDLSLELLVAAERDLGAWSKIIRSTEEVAKLADDWSSRHTTAELHVREASYRSAKIDSRTLLEAAERCATAVTAEPHHRIESALQALIICNDFFDAKSFWRVFATASRSFPVTTDCDLSVLRLHLVFHTLQGDLDYAVRLARRCIAVGATSGNPNILALCLRNALIPLRMSARFDEAIECAERALALSLSSQIPMAMLASAAALGVMHLAAGHFAAARLYSSQALQYLPDLDPNSANFDAIDTTATVALFTGDPEGAARLIEQRPLPETERTTRRGLESLAIRAVSAVRNDREQEVRAITPVLLDGALGAISWGSGDTIAAGLMYGLHYLDRSKEAASFMKRFLEGRRERYPLPSLFDGIEREAAR